MIFLQAGEDIRLQKIEMRPFRRKILVATDI